MAIGHRETIEKMAEVEIKVPGTYDSAFNSATELTLPYLIPIMQTAPKENPPLPPGEKQGDVFYGSTRIGFASDILRTISKRPVFPAATRQWANQLDDSWSDEEGHVALIGQWWDHNKEAIMEKRYNEATWLPRRNGKPIILSQEEIREMKAERQQEEHNHEWRRKESHSAAVSSDRSTKSADSDTWLVHAGVVTAFLSVIGWKLLKR